MRMGLGMGMTPQTVSAGGGSPGDFSSTDFNSTDFNT